MPVFEQYIMLALWNREKEGVTAAPTIIAAIVDTSTPPPQFNQPNQAAKVKITMLHQTKLLPHINQPQ
jgi:hypothetical protein